MSPPPAFQVYGIISARGRGTTLRRKNLHPLNGRPLLEHFLLEMGRATCFTKIFVWTEDQEIASVAASCGAEPLHRPQTMVHYGSSFHSPQEWDDCVGHQLLARFGATDHAIVHLNCNYVLFSAASIDRMFDTLMGAGDEHHTIYPFYRVHPGFWTENPQTGTLFPVLHPPGGTWRSHPNLMRRVGISIRHNRRAQRAREVRAPLRFDVPWYEGLDLERAEDIAFAEYMLTKRPQALAGCA